MAVVQLLSHRGSKTNLIHRLFTISQKWNASSYALRCIGTDDNSKRQYSGIATCGTKLQLQKLQSSPLYLANSKRNFEYNVFYLLVEALEHQFIYAKEFSGLDWWATIILCTMPYRVALSCYLKKKTVQQKYQTKHIFETLLQPLEKKERRKMMTGQYKTLEEKEKRRLFKMAMKEHQQRIYKQENFNPWAFLIYTFAPLPFWVANSWALRILSGASVPFFAHIGVVCPEMQTGGMLWFQNLCIADPYHILPVLTALSFLMTIELNTLINKNYGQKSKSVKPLDKLSTGVSYALRAWCVFSIYIFWNIPTAMTWYWCVSGVIALVTRLCLIHPSIEKRLAPANQHHSIDENPYRTILTNMNKRYNPRNWFIS